MSVTIQTKHTSRFIDLWPHTAFGAAVLVFLTLFLSPFFQNTLVSTTVSASEDEPAKLEPVQLKDRWIGGLRIDVRANIYTNQWVTYEIQLLDQQGQVLASALKQAWSESGTWYEEGQSGTWHEEDLLGGLDVRAKKNETVTLAIAVLEYGETSGQELDQPVSFQVNVKTGVVDTRYLWAGLFGTSSIALMTLMATPGTGRKAINRAIPDSDPSGRTIVGGPDSLVRVNIKVQSDETSPRQLNIRLSINDAHGDRIYARTFPTALNLSKDERGKITKAEGHVQAFFLLEPRTSYGFQVDVQPDGPVDWTSLKVLDGARTRQSVEVIHISPSPLEV